MSMHPRSLIANIVSGTLTAIIVIGLAYFIYEKQDSFSLFAPSGKVESDFVASPKPIASERIDEEQVENEMNRIAEEKRKAEAQRQAEIARQKAEEARKKAEAEKKRLAELEAKKKAEAAEQKRLDEIALKKKQEAEKKKKDEEARQQKLAEEKKEKQKQEEIKKKEEKAIADKKAADDAEKKRKAEEAKKAAAAAAAKAKADADAKAKAEAAAKADGLKSLEDAGYQARLAEVFRSQWNIGMDAIGYTAEVAIRVDKTGKILDIIESKSRWSGNDAFDANVRATVWRVGKIPVPQNKNGVERLPHEIFLITFDPKDQGLSYY